MTHIQRIGTSPRWSDVVIHRGVAKWVEVAEDPTQDARGQIAQVLAQVDATLSQLEIPRTNLLQVLVFLADLADAPTLNELWDAWTPRGHAPIRACVGFQLAVGYRVELVVEAGVEGERG